METVSRRSAIKCLGLGAAALAFSSHVRAEKFFGKPLSRELLHPQGMRPLRYDESVVYEGPDMTIRRIEVFFTRTEKVYPGHYMGANPETLQRINDLGLMAQEMVDGRRTGSTAVQAMMGLNGRTCDYDVNIGYRKPEGLK